MVKRNLVIFINSHFLVVLVVRRGLLSEFFCIYINLNKIYWLCINAVKTEGTDNLVRISVIKYRYNKGYKENLNEMCSSNLSLCETYSGSCVLPQTFIKELVAKLVGVQKQEELQSEGIEHPVICHSLHRHEPYHFNNPQHHPHHHFHHTRGHNQSLWWAHPRSAQRQTDTENYVGPKASDINKESNILTHFT